MDFFSYYKKTLENILNIINFPPNNREEFISKFLEQSLINSSFDLEEEINKMISLKKMSIEQAIKELILNPKFKLIVINKLVFIIEAFCKDISSNLFEDDKNKILGELERLKSLTI